MAVEDSYVPSSTWWDVNHPTRCGGHLRTFYRGWGLGWADYCGGWELESTVHGVAWFYFGKWQQNFGGQRILISRLVNAIAAPLPHDATEIQIHQYARCYILALLGDKLFMDKSGDRVHLMFLEFLRNLCDPPQYSWGSGCLAWLYRELCRASEKGHCRLVGRAPWSSIGHGQGCHSCARG